MEEATALMEELADSSGEESDEDESGDVARQVSQFFSELTDVYGRKRKRLMDEGVRLPKRRSVLPPHLHSVMGNANLRLARGDTSGTVDLCMEVVRQAPHSPEPYLTLATVYEERGEQDKLLQILAIAANLKRSDGELWVKTATLAVERENLSLAVECFSKAIKLDPKSASLLWQKASLLCELRENKKAVEAFEKLLKLLPPTAGTEFVEVYKEMARLHNELKEMDKAIECIKQAIDNHPTHVDEDAVNILAELYIVQKKYAEVYEIITDHYSMVSSQPSPDKEGDHMTSHEPPVSLTTVLRMSIAGEGMPEDAMQLEMFDQDATISEAKAELVVPGDMPVDLRIKLAVSLIHIGQTLPEGLLEPIFPSPEEYGDLYLDVIEAYMENGLYSQAIPLLSALVQTTKYSQAGVWLKHAECQHMLNDPAAAAISYSKVISLAPHHIDSRLKLATLYVQLGLVEDALSVLESDPHGGDDVMGEPPSDESLPMSSEVHVPVDQDIRVLVHRYDLLLSEGRKAECVSVGHDLLAFLLREVFYHPEIRARKGPSKKYLKEGRFSGDKTKTLEVRREEREQESQLSLEKWWAVFKQTVLGLYHLGSAHYPEVLHLLFCAFFTSRFSGGEHDLNFHYLAASLTHIVREHSLSFIFLRALCIKFPQYLHVWNLFNVAPIDFKLQKFLLRLAFKHSFNTHLMNVLANLTLANSNYRFALSQYESVYCLNPEDYMVCLCVAVVYLGLACQTKRSPNKNAFLTQASAFLFKYMKLRGRCQESMYNIGRAFHQLGVMHIACHCYRQVLTMEPECKLNKWSKVSDLRAEAAFNLSLIYRSSGNNELALQILNSFCTI